MQRYVHTSAPLEFAGSVLCMRDVVLSVPCLTGSCEQQLSRQAGNHVHLCLDGLLCICAQQLNVFVYVKHCSPRAHPASCSLDAAVVSSSLSSLEALHLLLSSHSLVLMRVWQCILARGTHMPISTESTVPQPPTVACVCRERDCLRVGEGWGGGHACLALLSHGHTLLPCVPGMACLWGKHTWLTLLSHGPAALFTSPSDLKHGLYSITFIADQQCAIHSCLCLPGRDCLWGPHACLEGG